MHRLKFKDDGFQRMLTHMMRHPRKLPYTTENTADYGLWLVKDDGIYVMSPCHMEDRDIEFDGSSVHVIYAKGYDRNQPDIWDKTYQVSRDDFAEFIPLEKKQVQRMMETCELEIGISETELEVVA